MSEWKKTFCALCYHNCGLEIQTERHRITSVRPDKNHPRTKGYICRKGMKIAHFQDNKARLTHPLKRENDQYVKVSWEQAISEIATKLKQIVERHGPRALAYMGGGGQGCHMDAGFGIPLLCSLGSQYHYSAIAQELTGLFWVNGRAYGSQTLHLVPDLDRAKIFLVMGWNGYVSNAGVCRTRRRINEFSKDPDKQLIVVDPNLSETAKRANKHFKIRIGTAALFLKSLISIIIQEGWENRAYLEKTCTGFEKIRSWFENFDVSSALDLCGVDLNEVKGLAHLYATQPTAMRTDLGILMDRQSTMNSYLETILMAICGRIGTPGGNVFPGHFVGIGRHTDEQDDKTWRTVETDIPAIMGFFPPNVFPEEVLSQKEDRVRALIVSGSNPLRSYADTRAYEVAFDKLELSVTIEIMMSETAQRSDYVLPAKSAFEKWDATFFSFNFPEIYFQVRQPYCEAIGEPLEEGEIHTRLADAMGLLPEIPQSLFEAAETDRMAYSVELLTWVSQDENNFNTLPFVLAKTLGRILNSAHLAALWGIIGKSAQEAVDYLARAGYEVSPLLGETVFQELLENPEGLLIGKVDPDKNLEQLKTQDNKIHLHIEELTDWVLEIEPEAEAAALNNDDFPLVLVAGRHYPYNANTNMRDPAMNDRKNVCTMLINDEDARNLGIKDGSEVWVSTAAGRLKISAEISVIPGKHTVIIPHGFGMVYDGEEFGANVNLLAKNTHRDRLAATPLHRYVPCRVDPA